MARPTTDTDATGMIVARIGHPAWLYWAYWAGLVLPVGLPILVMLLLPMLTAGRQPIDGAALLAFGGPAAAIVLLGSRVLRRTVLTIDEARQQLRIDIPRVFGRTRRVARPLSEFVALDLFESGIIRQPLYGNQSPLWSLVARFEDGDDVALRRDVLSAAPPWTAACTPVADWCARRDGRSPLPVAVGDMVVVRDVRTVRDRGGVRM